MSRWKASFIHLLISILIVGSVAAYVIYFWYPPALMPMAKADRLLMLIASVDLIVGPLLTLIVYKSGKKNLKIDLAIIALIQLSFLAYGLHTIWSSRPVFLVAVHDRFELVFANEISSKNLAAAKLPEFKNLGFTKPVLAGAVFPSDSKAKDSIMLSALSGQGDIQTMPQYFVSYETVKDALLTRAKTLDDSSVLSQAESSILSSAAKSYGFQEDELCFVALASSRNYAVMLLNRKTGDIVGPVNIDP